MEPVGNELTVAGIRSRAGSHVGTLWESSPLSFPWELDQAAALMKSTVLTPFFSFTGEMFPRDTQGHPAGGPSPESQSYKCGPPIPPAFSWVEG